MPTISEIEELVSALPPIERAALAARLLDSLDGVLFDEDEGVAEALRRDAEMDLHPEMGLTPAEFDRQVRQRRS